MRSSHRRLAGQAEVDGGDDDGMLALQLRVLQDFCELDTTLPKEAIQLLVDLMTLFVPRPVLGALLQQSSAVHLVTKRHILGPPHLARALICQRLEGLKRINPGSEDMSCCPAQFNAPEAIPLKCADKADVGFTTEYFEADKPVGGDLYARKPLAAPAYRRYSYLMATLLLFTWGATLACFAAMDWAIGVPCIITPG